MLSLLKKFRRNQSGATAIEYALIAGLISVAAIGAWTSVGTNITTKMTSIGSSVGSAGGN